MKSWISETAARRGSIDRLLHRAPVSEHVASCPRSRISSGQRADRRHILPAPFGDSRRDAISPSPDFTLPARVSLRSRRRRHRRRLRSSINSLHQLVPRAAESLTQARSNRHGWLRVSCLHPLKIGAVDLGKLAELLLRETRFCPQTGEIAAEDIRRRHPSSLTIPASQGRRISAAFSLPIPRPPASILIPAQAWNHSQVRDQECSRLL